MKTLDDLPITVRLSEIAELYAISEWSVRRKLASHDPSIPTPAFLSPLRWRRSDVKKHYDSWSISQQRVANAQREKAKRKLQAVS